MMGPTGKGAGITSVSSFESLRRTLDRLVLAAPRIFDSHGNGAVAASKNKAKEKMIEEE